MGGRARAHKGAGWACRDMQIDVSCSWVSGNRVLASRHYARRPTVGRAQSDAAIRPSAVRLSRLHRRHIVSPRDTLFKPSCVANLFCEFSSTFSLSLGSDSSVSLLTSVISTACVPSRSTQPCIPLGSLNRVPALIGRGKGGNVTSAGWQVILCDPISHVSSRSGVVLVAQTATRFLTFLLISSFVIRNSLFHSRLKTYIFLIISAIDFFLASELTLRLLVCFQYF